MATQDAFALFDLTAPAAPAPDQAPPPKTWGNYPEENRPRYQAPTRRTPPPAPPSSPPPIAYTGPNFKPGTRPSFADDIDSIVAALVADGLVTLDTETDTYRSTRRRSWRFEESQP